MLAARLLFTVWMLLWLAVMLPEVGPQNFFWLCNAAKFILLLALWTGNRLLVASQAGTVVLVGVGWTLDVGVGVLVGGSVTGLTAYMFGDELSLTMRLSSLYHVGLPVLVLWLLWRWGYDRRGWWLQCAFGTLLVIGGYLLTEPRRNINLAFQPEIAGWEAIPGGAWLVLLLVAYPLLVYLPGHLLLARLFTERPADPAPPGRPV